MSVQLRIDEVVCIACGVCVDSCPTDVLRTRDDGKAYAAYLQDCEACFLCVIDCPVDAIGLALSRAPLETVGPVPPARGNGAPAVF